MFFFWQNRVKHRDGPAVSPTQGSGPVVLTPIRPGARALLRYGQGPLLLPSDKAADSLGKQAPFHNLWRFLCAQIWGRQTVRKPCTHSPLERRPENSKDFPKGSFAIFPRISYGKNPPVLFGFVSRNWKTRCLKGQLSENGLCQQFRGFLIKGNFWLVKRK